VRRPVCFSVFWGIDFFRIRIQIEQNGGSFFGNFFAALWISFLQPDFALFLVNFFFPILATLLCPLNLHESSRHFPRVED
jgi:hypothetical protein